MKPLSTLITVKGLTFAYPGRGENRILNQIDWQIKQKDFIVLIGPNGSGKTTLVKLILGLLHPDAGSIERSLTLSEIGYTPQRYHIEKNFPGTVGEIFSAGGNKREVTPELLPLWGKRFIDLSGGQQQQILIALALKKNLRLLILDEPTSGVDIASREKFYRLLERLNREGMAVILVTHETIIPAQVNRIFYFGDRYYTGSPEEMKSILSQFGVELHFFDFALAE